MPQPPQSEDPPSRASADPRILAAKPPPSTPQPDCGTDRLRQAFSLPDFATSQSRGVAPGYGELRPLASHQTRDGAVDNAANPERGRWHHTKFGTGPFAAPTRRDTYGCGNGPSAAKRAHTPDAASSVCVHAACVAAPPPPSAEGTARRSQVAPYRMPYASVSPLPKARPNRLRHTRGAPHPSPSAPKARPSTSPRAAPGVRYSAKGAALTVAPGSTRGLRSDPQTAR